MDATMMREPLTTQIIFRRGERLFQDSAIVRFDGEGITTTSYREVAARARRLASALRGLGLARGERVGSFCWNRQAHLEAYLAVPTLGLVLHTLNVRLFEAQIEYIINHAEDRALLVDSDTLPLLRAILPRLTCLRDIIVVGEDDGKDGNGGGEGDPLTSFQGRVHLYEALLAEQEPLDEWPNLDENEAAVLCYTSGTTGNPKGVAYSHRSIFLHSLASMGADSFAISHRDRILMLPPMFHANAWGTPFSGWFAGADLVLPGPHLQPEKIARAIALTKPSFTAAVPTILNDLLQLHARAPLDLSCFRTIISGGSAVSPALIEKVYAAWGVWLVQGWGLTETSPLCVLSHPPRDAAPNEESAWRAKSGRPVAGIEVRIVDEQGALLPEDGVTAGNLQLRGPWIACSYFRQAESESPATPDGWLRTGDAGTIDARGYVQIVDRTKDLIKSGGEWISSVELENWIARYPGVYEVAVIGVPDPRWEERPLAVLALGEGVSVEFSELRTFLAKHIAKFMVPEYWALCPRLPKTSIGKIDKKQLRQDAAAGVLCYIREMGML